MVVGQISQRSQRALAFNAVCNRRNNNFRLELQPRLRQPVATVLYVRLSGNCGLYMRNCNSYKYSIAENTFAKPRKYRARKVKFQTQFAENFYIPRPCRGYGGYACSFVAGSIWILNRDYSISETLDLQLYNNNCLLSVHSGQHNNKQLTDKKYLSIWKL